MTDTSTGKPARQTKTPAQRAQEEVDVLERRAERLFADVKKHDKAAKEAKAALDQVGELLTHAKSHPALRNVAPVASEPTTTLPDTP